MRFKFLDLLKAYAILMMVQGHTLHAVLEPVAKQTAFYQFLHMVRGLTAPCFIFASGCGIAFSLYRKKESDWIKILRHRITRILSILAVGYFLQLPRFSLMQILTQLRRDEIVQLFRCDILQTIGFTIIIMQIVILVLRKEKLIILFSLIILPLIILLTPELSNSVKSPNFLTQLVTPKFGSNFPLFPFSAYFILGLLFGLIFHRFHFEVVTVKTNILIAISAMLLFSVSFVVQHPDFSLFYFRSGLLLGLVVLLLILEKIPGKILNFFSVIGQESFLIYLVHLVIVYGSVLNVNNNFVSLFGEKLSTMNSILLASGLIVFMVALGYMWHYLKTKHPIACLIIRYGISTIVITKFIVS